jgi:hypothetical protein
MCMELNSFDLTKTHILTCLCDELVTRPEESYRLRCVVVCNLETSRMRRPCPVLGRSATKKKKHILTHICFDGDEISHLMKE